MLCGVRRMSEGGWDEGRDRERHDNEVVEEVVGEGKGREEWR